MGVILWKTGERPAMKNAKREEIIDSAVALFAKEGISGYTLRDIAQHSGFKLGSIYHFFPQKQQLYFAAVARAFDWCTAAFVEALSGNDPAEARFRRFALLVFTLFTRDDPHIKLIDRAHLEGLEGHTELYAQRFTEMHAVLDPLVAELARYPSSRPPPWVAGYVFSLIYGAAKLHVQHGPMLHVQSRARKNAFLDGLIEFALKGLSGSAPARSAPRKPAKRKR
jgi:AcrR family transcriptional regulator